MLPQPKREHDGAREEDEKRAGDAVPAVLSQATIDSFVQSHDLTSYVGRTQISLSFAFASVACVAAADADAEAHVAPE